MPEGTIKLRAGSSSFTHSFIHSSHECIWSTFSGPGTVQDPRDTAANKTQRLPARISGS